MARLDPSVSLRPSAPGVAGRCVCGCLHRCRSMGGPGAGRRRAGRDVARGSCPGCCLAARRVATFLRMAWSAAGIIADMTPFPAKLLAFFS